MAATIPAVGAPGEEFVWAKLFNPAPNNTITIRAIFLFMAKLNPKPNHGSTRKRVYRTYRRRHRLDLNGRGHPQIAWAKLRALRDGAAIASKKLWS